MKLSKRIISIALAMIMILSTSSVFAADYDLKISETGELKSFLDWIFDDAVFLDVMYSEGKYLIECGGKYYKAEDVIEKSTANPNAELDELVKDLEPVAEEPDELKVVSVSAINAKEIKVVFSQKVDEATAETVTNYKMDGTALASPDVAKLQEDGKTVIIELNTPMTKNTAYTIEVVGDVIYNEAKTEKVPAYTTGIFFVDNEKPVVTEVKAEENGDVTIVFSEKLDTAVAVTVYIDGRAVTSSPVAPNADGTVTVPKANLPAGLENGKSYSIYVSGAKDLAGNEMNLYTGTFTYSYTVTAPVLKTATAKDEKTIEIEFSKDIATTPTPGTEVKVYKDNVELTGTTDYTIAPVGASAKKYTITLTTPAGTDKVYANDATSAQLKIVAEGYKDTLTPPNIGVKVEKTVTLNKDLTKPALKGAVTYDPVTSTITVNFNKELAAGSVASGIKVIDEDSVLYTAVNASGTIGKLVAADLTGGEEKIEIVNNDGTSAVLPNGTYTLIIEKDTVKDTTLNANGNDRIVTTFTIAGAPSTTKPVVTGITNTTPGIIEVTFSTAVKGTTATNPANYKIDGIAIPADSTLYLDPTKTIVTIELPEGYFATTAARVVTVANVESIDGVKMDKQEDIVTLFDNTRPKLLSAKVVDNELVLTFSEDLTGATIDKNDFEVKVNNVLATVAAGTLTGLEKNQISISVTDANLATGTITVKVIDAAAGADAAGNPIVTGTTVTATR